MLRILKTLFTMDPTSLLFTAPNIEQLPCISESIESVASRSLYTDDTQLTKRALLGCSLVLGTALLAQLTLMLLTRKNSPWKQLPSVPENSIPLHFLGGLPLSDSDVSSTPVQVTRMNRGKRESAQLWANTNQLAKYLGVPKSSVDDAFLDDMIPELILRALLVPNDYLEKAYPTDATGLTSEQARFLAIISNEIRDCNTFLGTPLGAKQSIQVHLGHPVTLEIHRTADTPAHPDLYTYFNRGKECALGLGAFGTVFTALRETVVPASTDLVAQKIISTETRADKAAARREARALKTVQNVPYVMKILHGVKREDELWIVTELGDGGPLTTRIGKTHTTTINPRLRSMDAVGRWRFFLQILRGVQGIHDTNLVHRDLKGPNIVLKTGEDGTTYEPRIGDFGSAAALGSKGPYIGSLLFSPPEVILTNEDVTATKEWDAFSAGVLALEGIIGKSPFFWFASSSKFDLIQQMADVHGKPADWVVAHLASEALSSSIVDAIKGLLHGSPDLRMNIPDAIALIEEGVAELREAEANG